MTISGWVKQVCETLTRPSILFSSTPALALGSEAIKFWQNPIGGLLSSDCWIDAASRCPNLSKGEPKRTWIYTEHFNMFDFICIAFSNRLLGIIAVPGAFGVRVGSCSFFEALRV